MRDPVFLHFHQGFNGLDKVLHRNFGDAEAGVGVVHTAGIAVRAEQLNLIFRSAVGLQAFKTLLRVVKHHRGGVQRDRAIRDNAGVVPALARVIVHDEHMVNLDIQHV